MNSNYEYNVRLHQLVQMAVLLSLKNMKKTQYFICETSYKYLDQAKAKKVFISY